MADSCFKLSAFFTVIVLEVSLVLVFFTGSNMNWSEIFRNLDPKCDVINSTIIRKLVEKNWNPVLNRYGVTLPIECPLNLSRDMFRVREHLKERSSSHWKCKKCGKRFYLEKYLDLHLDRRHSNIIRKADDSVCLGSYCDVMRCDILKSIHASRDDFTSTDISVWTPSRETHELEPGNKPLTNQKPGHPQIEPYPRKFSEFQIQTEECDEDHFALLRSKCSEIIWECIQGLISVLDAQDFRSIQEDLEKSSCSYLTCSRHGDSQTSHYSRLKGMRPFLLVFGSLLISLCLALAYYFAWVYTQGLEETAERYRMTTPSKRAKYYEENLPYLRSKGSPAIVNKTSHI